MATIKTTVELQYGDTNVAYDDLVKRAKEATKGKSVKKLDLYVKPEENRVYYVVNGDADNTESFAIAE